jgi:glycerol-3-phosphate dehydrogenase (NAD(P)+)
MTESHALKEIIHDHPVGVIGSGSFGTTLAILISNNANVLLYTRNKEVVETINTTREWQGVRLSDNITAIDDIARFTAECILIFPVVPSKNFRDMMIRFAPYLKPRHILIHGTKGFGLTGISEEELINSRMNRSNIRTMSEIILEESSVIRVGCVSGPNLSREILDGQPAATVIASHFDEVREAGKLALDSNNFAVFGSSDLIGAELAGALKNVIALASGILGGLNMGKNIQSMLITRGLREMILIGNALGAEARSFLGTAGIGDLIATATSENSRNYTFGMRMAKGESFDDIINSMPEIVEGVRTLKIVQQLALNYRINTPIMTMLYKVIYDNFKLENAIHVLMRYPYDQDVDFL